MNKKYTVTGLAWGTSSGNISRVGLFFLPEITLFSARKKPTKVYTNKFVTVDDKIIIRVALSLHKMSK